MKILTKVAKLVRASVKRKGKTREEYLYALTDIFDEVGGGCTDLAIETKEKAWKLKLARQDKVHKAQQKALAENPKNLGTFKSLSNYSSRLPLTKEQKKRKQLAHLKRYRKEFDAILQTGQSLEDYFAGYFEQFDNKGDSIYIRICSDIGIEPIKEIAPEPILE